MTEGQRMTAANVVAQAGEGRLEDSVRRLEDFVREAVVLVTRENQAPQFEDDQVRRPAAAHFRILDRGHPTPRRQASSLVQSTRPSSG